MLFNGHCSHVQNGEATPSEQRNGSKDWPKISINQRGGAAGPLLQVYWLNFNLQDTFRFFPWFLQWNMGWSATYFGIGKSEMKLLWRERKPVHVWVALKSSGEICIRSTYWNGHMRGVGPTSQQYGVYVLLINPLYIAFMVVSLVVADELQYNYNPNDHSRIFGIPKFRNEQIQPPGFLAGVLVMTGSFDTNMPLLNPVGIFPNLLFPVFHNSLLGCCLQYH